MRAEIVISPHQPSAEPTAERLRTLLEARGLHLAREGAATVVEADAEHLLRAVAAAAEQLRREARGPIVVDVRLTVDALDGEEEPVEVPGPGYRSIGGHAD
jgi:hypothetical protein